MFIYKTFGLLNWVPRAQIQAHVVNRLLSSESPSLKFKVEVKIDYEVSLTQLAYC